VMEEFPYLCPHKNVINSLVSCSQIVARMM
jgi:hypothetical protein